MSKKLTEYKKDLLRQFVDRICENCHKHENEVGTLQVHRIRRGCQGGLYELRNVKIICEKCHKVFHQREF